MAKQDEVRKRRVGIMELASALEGGKALYKEIAAHYGVSEKTIKLDCIELEKDGHVERCRCGIKITSPGIEALQSGSIAQAKLIKRKHLRQLIILRILARNRKLSNGHGTGLTHTDIFLAMGMEATEVGFTKDIVKKDLEELASEGLVEKAGERYLLGNSLMAPIHLDQKQARLLQHYLNCLPAVVPIEPEEMFSMREKLDAVLLVGRNDNWYEEQIKLSLREIVHGYLPETSQNTNIAGILEQCATRGQVAEVVYRGRKVKLRPLALIYHWRRGLWYVIAYGRRRGKNLLVYRLDRIEKAESTEQTFPRPGQEEISGLLLEQYWGVSGDKTFSVTIKFKNTAWDTSH